MDVDQSTTDDIVDDIIIDIQFNDTILSVPIRDYLSTHSIVNMTLGYSLRCAQNFFGSNCSIQCVDTDDDVAGHFVCDENGNKVCRHGYQDLDSDCTKPVPTVEPG